MEEIKIDFWDLENVEILRYYEMDEAIEMILDDMEVLPETLEICGWQRKKLDIKSESENIIDTLIERLDEEYGGEDGTEITPEMKKLAEEFMTKINALYTPWQCDIVREEVIDVNKWVKENKPHWFDRKTN